MKHNPGIPFALGALEKSFDTRLKALLRTNGGKKWRLQELSSC